MIKIRVLKNNKKDSITLLLERVGEKKAKETENKFPNWSKLFEKV